MNDTASVRYSFLQALSRYGYNPDELSAPDISPLALARRKGIPEAHITGAVELIHFPIARDNQPAADDKPGLMIGTFNGEPVYSAHDPLDAEVIRLAGGTPAYAPLSAGAPPPEQVRPAAAEVQRERPIKTVMDALYVLGVGDIQLEELSEPDYHENLLHQGRITYDELARAYAQLMQLPYVDVRRNPPHPEVRNVISSTIIRKYGVIPHSRKNNELLILTANPTDAFALVAIEDELQGAAVKMAVAAKPDIEHLLLTLYQRAVQEEALAQEAAGRRAEQSGDSLEIADDPNNPVTQRINAAFQEAVANGASDIHFQPQRDGLVVRERIDGNLITRGLIPRELAPTVINRLKILTGISLEDRRPQDGRINMMMTVAGREHELRLRVSSLPSIYGDSIVMRLLGDSEHLPKLEHMHFSEVNLQAIREAMESSHGLILVSGPTGSGKTTLLHSMLKRLNTPAVKIMTIEDPIEYEQPWLVQTEIRKTGNEALNLSWAQVLHAQLRQDPNIILVGEIRDGETASIATEGAQTGRLLISTVHANSAIGSITRISELGVPHFLLGDVMRLAIAQRLVGRPCPDCSVEEPMPEQYAPAEGATMLVGTGLRDELPCPLCNGTGDKGVIPIHEVLPMNAEVRQLIKEGRFELLRATLQGMGYPTLMQDGLQKVAEHKANLKSLLQSIK